MKRPDRGSGSIKVGRLLKEFLEKHPAFEANPIGDWKDLVGEQVARHTIPRSLKNKVLTIAAHDLVWKHHMEQLKEVLTEKINSRRPEPIVDRIVIKVSEIPESSPVLNPAHTKLENIKGRRYATHKRARAPAGKLSPEEQSLIKSLPDPDLQKIGAKLLKRIPEGSN